jgi:hypothetical protein
MTAKVLEGFSGKLAEQWVATLLTPAFVFWAGGLAIYTHRIGWDSLTKWYSQYPEPLQIGILVIGLCLVAASAFVAQRFDTEVLRALEGYWYPGIRRFLQPLIKYQRHRKSKIRKRFNDLDRTLSNNTVTLTANNFAEHVQLDRALRQFPREDYDMMPFRIGNILRSAERYSGDRYGLDAIVCWTRLWLLLPDATKKDIQDSRTELNNAVRLFLWSFLFLVWTIWSWWAIPISAISAAFAYCWTIDAAEVYVSLIEATFDLHRHLLYQALRWEIPKDPNEERRVGKQLTNYLWIGKVDN